MPIWLSEEAHEQWCDREYPEGPAPLRERPHSQFCGCPACSEWEWRNAGGCAACWIEPCRCAVPEAIDDDEPTERLVYCLGCGRPVGAVACPCGVGR